MKLRWANKSGESMLNLCFKDDTDTLHILYTFSYHIYIIRGCDADPVPIGA